MKEKEADAKTQLLASWKAVGLLSFIGMIVGVLIITAFIPLSVIVIMDKLDLDLLAVHCLSMHKSAMWCVGIGSLTCLIYFIEGLSIIIRKKTFSILCLALVCCHLLCILGLMVAGITQTNGRKQLMKENWNNFDPATKTMIQKHFSCCGFDDPNDATTKDASCFVMEDQNITWSDGCYQKIISTSLKMPTFINFNKEKVMPEGGSWNNFICTVSLLFISLFTVDFMNIFGMAFLIKATDFNAVNNCSKTTSSNLMEKRKSTATTVTVLNEGGTQSANDMDQNVRLNQIDLDVENQNIPWYAVPSHFFTMNLEKFFYWVGHLVGKHPKTTILLSFIFAGALTLGVLQRKDNALTVEGYLSPESRVVEGSMIIAQYFQRFEYHKLIIENDNVLSNDVIEKSWNVDKSIKSLTSSMQITFDKFCVKYDDVCQQEGLFDVWGYNDTGISSLTQEDIQQSIRQKSPLQSPVFGGRFPINNIIGGQELDSSGEIISAKAHKMVYVTKPSHNDDWQEKFIKYCRDNPQDLKVYVNAASSYNTENSDSNTQELWLLVIGFVLIFCYISIMSGKISKVRQRTWLAVIAIGIIGLSMGVGIGLSASLGYVWFDLHVVVPLLILGIGVDDMFLMLQTWNIVLEDPRLQYLPMEEKAGAVLKTVGVSITVTSVTDLVVFAVGATSVMSMLQSFSLYISLCIIFLFILQCTLFLACTVLDQQRREKNRDACFCCFSYPRTYLEGDCASREIFQRFFDNGLSVVLQNKFVRIAVIIVSLGGAGVMGWACYKLPIEFDTKDYVSSNSYLQDFMKKDRQYFPQGYEGNVYVTSDNLYEERSKLVLLEDVLLNNTGVDSAYVDSWYAAYERWSDGAKNITDEAEFYEDVSKFLNSSDGLKYKYDVVFIGKSIPACRIYFRHVDDDLAMNNVQFMNNLYSEIDAINFTKNAFPHSDGYTMLELTELIDEEIYKNLGLSLAAVFVIVLLTLANFQMALWVGMCVLMTMVEVAGYMYFAGMAIEFTLELALILAVGLAVDYAAHVGHKFLTLKGSRDIRTRGTLSQVGPAVFNGGFSTFLALVSFSLSSVYGNRVFFMIFSCVTFFGLWNGLVFLPSVLGSIGPEPYRTATYVIMKKHSSNNRKISISV